MLNFLALMLRERVDRDLGLLAAGREHQITPQKDRVGGALPLLQLLQFLREVFQLPHR